MDARQKLNRAYLNGSLIVAGVVGTLAGSWVIFGVALIALLAWNLHVGEIRPHRRIRHF